MGGQFVTAGGSNVNKIAQWDGSNWSGMGSGVHGNAETSVTAFALSGSTLYVGGVFSTAGTNAASDIAVANLPTALAIITTNASFGFTNGMFGFDVVGPSGSNVVIQSSVDLQNWISLQTNGLDGSGLFYFSDPQSSVIARRYYQVKFP